MTEVQTAINLSQHDDIFQQFVDMHAGLSTQDTLKVTAKLALVLANHIGDRMIISKAIAIASKTEADPGLDLSPAQRTFLQTG